MQEETPFDSRAGRTYEAKTIVIPAGRAHVDVEAIPGWIADVLEPIPPYTEAVLVGLVKLVETDRKGVYNDEPLTTEDWEFLDSIWSHLPRLSGNITAEQYKPYRLAFDRALSGLDVSSARPRVRGLHETFNDPHGEAQSRWMDVRNRHRHALADAAKRGAIAILDGATRQRVNRIQRGAIMSVADLRAYLAECGIELREGVQEARMEFISLSEIVRALAETAEALDTNFVRIPMAARQSRAAAALHSLLVTPPNFSVPRPKMVDKGREDGQVFLDDSAAEEAIDTLQYWGTWTPRVKMMRADRELKSGGPVDTSDEDLYNAIRVEDDKFINDTFIRLTEIGFDLKQIADYLRHAGVFLEFRPADTAIEKSAQAIRDRTPAALYDGEGCSDELRSLTRLSKYLQYDTWSPLWASLLACGIEPPSECKDWPREATTLAGTFLRGDSHFAEAKRIFALWNSQIDAPDKVTPSDFVSWCETKGIDTDWLRTVPRGSASENKQVQSDGTNKRWTDAELARLGKCRAEHGTKVAAKKFEISEALVRKLLPSEKKKPPSANDPFSMTRNRNGLRSTSKTRKK